MDECKTGWVDGWIDDVVLDRPDAKVVFPLLLGEHQGWQQMRFGRQIEADRDKVNSGPHLFRWKT